MADGGRRGRGGSTSRQESDGSSKESAKSDVKITADKIRELVAKILRALSSKTNPSLLVFLCSWFVLLPEETTRAWMFMRELKYVTDPELIYGLKNTSMGSGRGGRSEEKLGREQAYGQEISLGNQRERFAEEPDSQQRRAGQRFHYRRRARWRKLLLHGWEAFSSLYFRMACVLLFLVMPPTLSYVGTLANVSVAGLPSRFVLSESTCYVFISRSVSSDGAPHRGILAATPATTGAMCANANRFIHPWMASVQAGLRVQWTSAFTKFFTLPRALRHPPTLPAICAHHSSRLPATAPPIASNRPPAQPDRADPSSPPASMRPAAPPACRPNCLGRLAWTRQPLGRAAQRLHTGKPCHAVLHSTLHTLQEYGKENYEKKTPIHRSNNVFQDPGGGTCAQHTWHQLWTRANPAYVFLVPQPLAPHNNRSLRAGTRAASTRPRTPAHTLPHGRLQRTDGPSFRDLRLRGRPSASLAPLLTRIAAASPAPPALQPTWGSPATLLVLVGVWVDTCVQRMRDRHGTHSAPAVQFMGTPASAVSQTRPEQQPRNQQLGIASHSAPSCLSELGSETSDSCMTGAHGYLTEQLELDRALLTGALQPKFDTSVWNSRGKASQHSTPPRTSELGSGMTSRCAVHDHSPYIAEKNPGTLQLDLDTPLWNSRGKALQHSAPSSISELGSGMTSGCAVSGLTGNPCLAERTKRRADLELESQALRKCFRRGDRRKQLEAEQLKRATAADDHRHPGTTERPDSLGTVDPETQPWREQRQADCSNKATRTASAPSLMECPQAAASNLPPSNTPLSDAPPLPLLPTADAPLKPSSPSNPAPGGRSWNTDPQALNA